MRWTSALPLFAAAASALDGPGWRSQSIYQVVTDRFARTDGSTTASCSLGNYCGGTFQGLIKKLDYIQGMGFTAVWISPVIANLNTSTPYGLPYHGYWPQDNYKINPNFGTAADLVSLSKALHDRGMYLMVDIVPNHHAYNGAPAKVKYSDFVPFNNVKYFHTPYCKVDYDNTSSITNCWVGDQTVALPDIKTEDPTVQSMWNAWVTSFVANYSIDGLRVDSAQQINKDFFPTFVSAGGVYQVGEVLNGGPDYLCDYQNYMTSVLNYAYYFWIKNSFSAGGSLKTLSNNIGWLKSTCNDVTLMPTFIENHDQARWPSFVNDSSLIANAIAFTVMSDGIPLIYYGQEQSFSGATDPNNREPFWPSKYDTTTDLYKFIGQLNTFRNFAITKDSSYASNTGKSLYSDASTLVRMKGSSGNRVISIWNNDGNDADDRIVSLSTSLTGFGGNIGFTDIVSCTVYTTDSSGTLNVTISGGMPLVLYHANGLSGSSVCSTTKTASTSAAAATSAAPVRVVSSAAAPVVSSTSTSTSAVKTTSTTLATSTVKTTSTSIASSTSTVSSTSVAKTTSTSSSIVVPTSTSVVKTTSVASTTSVIPTTSSVVVKTTSTTPTSTTPDPTTSSVVKTTSSVVPSTTSTSKVESTTSSSSSSSVVKTTSTSSVAPTTSSTSSVIPTTSSISVKTSSSSPIPSSTTPDVKAAATSSASSTSPAQPSSTLAISTNNQCGAAVGLTCAGSSVAKGGQCCSRYNSCGATADYCCPQRRSTGGGCQAGFGNCLDEDDPICTGATVSSSVALSSATVAAAAVKSSSSSSSVAASSTATSPAQASILPVSTNNQCGASVGTTCLGNTDSRGGPCCSRYNSCGKTADYCCPQRLSTGGGCQAGFGNCLDASDPICVAATGGTTIASSTSVSTAAPKTSSPSSSSAAPTTSSSVKSTSTSSNIKSTSTKITCTPPTSVPVLFAVNATTTWGQGVYLTGSSDELNNWNTSVALTMSSKTYPIWQLNVTMDVGEYFEYKFFKAAGGDPSWEKGDNRNFTVPTVTACTVDAPVATIGGDWQSSS